MLHAIWLGDMTIRHRQVSARRSLCETIINGLDFCTMCPAQLEGKMVNNQSLVSR